MPHKKRQSPRESARTRREYQRRRELAEESVINAEGDMLLTAVKREQLRKTKPSGMGDVKYRDELKEEGKKLKARHIKHLIKSGQAGKGIKRAT